MAAKCSTTEGGGLAYGDTPPGAGRLNIPRNDSQIEILSTFVPVELRVFQRGADLMDIWIPLLSGGGGASLGVYSVGDIHAISAPSVEAIPI